MKNVTIKTAQHTWIAKQLGAGHYEIDGLYFGRVRIRNFKEYRDLGDHWYLELFHTTDRGREVSAFVWQPTRRACFELLSRISDNLEAGGTMRFDHWTDADGEVGRKLLREVSFSLDTTPEPTDPTPRGTVTREAAKPGKPKAAKSSVIYRGPSLIDGAPIVAVAVVKSGNTKTGNMVQTYIIRDDVAPVEASRIGADRSVCGDCPHRGVAHDGSSGAKQALNRSCYVVLGQGPTGVFKANQKGNYPDALDHDARAAIGAGRMVRLGTYGDPAAVPSHVWDSLISDAIGHTAYSHQNGVAGADYRSDLFMRSADTLDEALDAWADGQRTFRVITSDAERIPAREVLCPASEEAGRRVTCEKCKLCAGSSIAAKSVAIVAHGAGATHFTGAA